MSDKNSDFDDVEMPDWADTVLDANSHADQVAHRLREAVTVAGGNKAVIERSGIPSRTLGYYLAGRDMKSEALVALANACGVAIEWLATGRGPMALFRLGQPAFEDPEGAAARGDKYLKHNPDMPANKPEKPAPGLFATVDVDRLANALGGADQAIRAQGGEPNWHALAQVALLLYDEATRRIQNVTES